MSIASGANSGSARVQSLFFLCLALSFFAPRDVRAADIERILPDDTQVIISLDIRQILDSDIAKKYELTKELRKSLTHDSNYSSMLTSMDSVGLDPLKDIHRLTLATPGRLDGEHYFLCVHGRFDAARIHAEIEKLMRDHPKAIACSKEGAFHLYDLTFEKDGKREGIYACLKDDTLMTSPVKGYLLEAIEKSAGKREAKFAKPLQTLVGRQDAKTSAWGAALATPAMREELAKLPQAKQLAEKLECMSGAITLSGGIDAQILLQATDATVAKDARQKLEGAKAFGLLAVKEVEQLQGLAPLITELLEGTRVSQDIGLVTVEVKVTAPTITQVAALVRNQPLPVPSVTAPRQHPLDAPRPVIAAPPAAPPSRPVRIPPEALARSATAPAPSAPRTSDKDEAALSILRANAAAAESKSTAIPASASVSHDEVDRRIKELLRDAFWEGAHLYNDTRSGEVRYTRSAYYFQATIKSMLPLLEHRPDLQLDIRRRLEKAEHEKDMDDRAWKMRGVMVHAWRQLNVMPDGVPPVPPPPPDATLWGRLGRERGVRKIVDEWIDESIRDPKVNFFRSGAHRLNDKQIDDLKWKLVALASDIGGGPIKYPGKLMSQAHEGMDITNEEFDQMVSHLKRALVRNKVKESDIENIFSGIEVVRKSITDRKRKVPPGPKTVWERIGGEPVVTRVVSDWIDASVADQRHNFFREGKRKLTPEQIVHLKQQIVRLASTLTKGPLEYHGRNLAEIHQPLAITGAEFDAMVSHLRIAMVKNEVKAPEMEFILKAMEAVKGSVVAAGGK